MSLGLKRGNLAIYLIEDDQIQFIVRRNRSYI